MTVFLFDNDEGETLLIECTNWSEAETLAAEEGFFLLGEYIGEKTYE